MKKVLTVSAMAMFAGVAFGVRTALGSLVTPRFAVRSLIAAWSVDCNRVHEFR